jgi:hypothetical protein
MSAAVADIVVAGAPAAPTIFTARVTLQSIWRTLPNYPQACRDSGDRNERGSLMSTKDIMKQHFEKDTGRSFQVYNEIFDEEGEVYLELEGFHFEAASSGGIGVVNGRPRLVVQLPREWAQKIGLLENVRRNKS